MSEMQEKMTNKYIKKIDNWDHLMFFASRKLKYQILNVAFITFSTFNATGATFWGPVGKYTDLRLLAA